MLVPASIASHINFLGIVVLLLMPVIIATYYINATPGQCLSPAGEYNLRLGIIKELHPDMVATYSGRCIFCI